MTKEKSKRTAKSSVDSATKGGTAKGAGRAAPVSSADSQKLVRELAERVPFPNLIALHGTSSIRKSRIIDFLKDAAVKSFDLPPSADCTIARYHCDTLKAENLERLVLQSSNFGLFREPVFIELFEVTELSKGLTAALARLVRAIAGSDTVLFLNGTKALPAGEVKDRVKELGTLIQLGEFTPPEFERWLHSELTRAGIPRYDARLVSQLVQQSSGDVDLAAQMIERLSLFVGESEEATVEQLLQLYPAELKVGDFVLLDQIANGQISQAQLTLHNYFQQGKGAFQLNGLLLSIYQDYIRLAAAALAIVGAARTTLDQPLGRVISSVPSARLAEQLGSPEWKVRKQLGALRNYSWRKLLKCNQVLLHAESKLKNTSLMHENILAEAVNRLSVG